MPFKPVFERKVNKNMQEAEASGSGEMTPGIDDDVDIKKQSCGPDPENEAQDIEMSEKGMKDKPPRFSTLFAETVRQSSCDHSIPLRKKRGITISTPVFVVLAITLFLETTLLFAYTVIGLYNNLPPQLGASNRAGLATSCDCDGQPSINIAPNFYLPSGQGGVGSPLPIHGSPLVDPAPILPGSVSIISSITAFPTTLPTGTPLADKAVESHLLSLLEQQLTNTDASTATSSSKSSSSSTTTTTKPTSPVATPQIVTSLKTVPAPSLVTATSIKTLPAPTVTVNTTVGQRAVDSSTRNTTPGSAATSTTTGKPTATTATTTGDAGAESSKTTASATSKATFPACFGGSGGAELVCPSGIGKRRRLLRW